MRVSAAGHLAGAGSSIVAAIVKATTSRSTAPFPVPQASAPALLLPRIAGDGLEWQNRPGFSSVNSVNSVFMLPSRLHGRPERAEACVVPVFEPRVTDTNCRLFAPLSPVCQVSPLCLDQFRRELCNHPDQLAVNYVLSGIQHRWF